MARAFGFTRRPSFFGCKPDSVHPEMPLPANRSCAVISLSDYYPRSRPGLRSGHPGRRPVPLFCLAPPGVYRAPVITAGAVGSYPAFSPLPSPLAKSRRYVLCDTFRRARLSPVAPAHSTRQVALRCPDFPPAEPFRARRATTRQGRETITSREKRH